MKKRKGSTLILVVGIFVVMAMFSVIVTTLTMQNTLATRLQIQRQQAYYLVLTGIELATNAAYQPNAAEGKDTYILSMFEEGADSNLTFTDQIKLCEHPGDCADHSQHREINIRLRATDNNGTFPCPSNADIWLEIFVTGIVTNGSRATSHAGSIRISTIEPTAVVRELESPLDF